MPNDFAYFTLLVWPIVSIVLYKTYPVITATFWTVVGGYLLLPVGVEFNFPLIPSLDKKSIPAIMGFLGCRYIANQKIRFLPPSGVERNLILMLFIGSVATVLTNGEPVIEPNRYIPGLRLRDILSTVASQWLTLAPFILGLQIVKKHEDQVQFLYLLIVAGLWYSTLIIFEIRMSPQLHTWVYGFFPHSWVQQIRYGGFRPVVFLGHGLWISMFIFTVLGSMLAISKIRPRSFRIPDLTLIIFLVVLVVLSKGLGAIMLSLFFLTAMIFLNSNLIMKLSFFLSLTAICYPLLCIANVFPHQSIIDIVSSIDQVRADSLNYRFNQESAFLERATEKLFFGWGDWGRGRVDKSVTDGYWVNVVGEYGLIGYTALFGLIINSIYKIRKQSKVIVNKDSCDYIAATSLVIALLMVDQIPNASINPLMWLLVGSFSGIYQRQPEVLDQQSASHHDIDENINSLRVHR